MESAASFSMNNLSRFVLWIALWSINLLFFLVVHVVVLLFASSTVFYILLIPLKLILVSPYEVEQVLLLALGVTKCTCPLVVEVLFLQSDNAVADDVSLTPLLLQILNCAEEKLQSADTVTACLVSVLGGLNMFTLQLLVEGSSVVSEQFHIEKFAKGVNALLDESVFIVGQRC